jgi:hypothetical protein
VWKIFNFLNGVGFIVVFSSEAQKNQPTEREPTSELVFCYLQTD